MNKEKKPQSSIRVVIVGGGFAGIQTALSLSRDKNFCGEITLISDKENFEYYPALYRMILGKPRMQISIPLSEILLNTGVRVVVDKLHSIDEKEMLLRGATGHYKYDKLVLAMGTETIFFGVKGISEHSLPFKSVRDAGLINKYLHEFFKTEKRLSNKNIILADGRIVIIGGGPTGVEVAVEIAIHSNGISKKYKISDMPKVTLVELADRVLGVMPEKLSRKVEDRLRSLGVELILNTPVSSQDEHYVYLGNGKNKIESNLVIWTAGVKPVSTYEKVSMFSIGKGGRVLVDEYLRAKGYENIFILGDSADTPYAGSAQTAIYDGSFVAKTISKMLNGVVLKKYKPKRPVYIVPIGKWWAVLAYKSFWFSGFIPFLIRGFADFKFFVSWLGFKNAISHFFARR